MAPATGAVARPSGRAPRFYRDRGRPARPLSPTSCLLFSVFCILSRDFVVFLCYLTESLGFSLPSVTRFVVIFPRYLPRLNLSTK
jgi:hypothetical protein